MKSIAHFMKTALVLAGIVIGGAIAYAYSGYYDVSVGTGHNALTHWYLETLRHHSIERRAAQLEVPPLADEEMIRNGAIGYNQACAGCHGRPGRPPSDSFDPAPPALTRHQHDPAATFWVIRNGIKMSAMPARGEDRMSDDQVWQVVAFMQTASRLTEGEYRELTEPPPDPEPAEDQAPATGAEGAGTEENGNAQEPAAGEEEPANNQDGADAPSGDADDNASDG